LAEVAAFAASADSYRDLEKNSIPGSGGNGNAFVIK
jgi:hypothetical protein